MCREQDRCLQERATAQRLFELASMLAAQGDAADDTVCIYTRDMHQPSECAVVQYIGQPQSMAYYILAVGALSNYRTGAAAQYANVHSAL
eukprot:3327-Heterococcus_DN1.PRE.2